MTIRCLAGDAAHLLYLQPLTQLPRAQAPYREKSVTALTTSTGAQRVSLNIRPMCAARRRRKGCVCRMVPSSAPPARSPARPPPAGCVFSIPPRPPVFFFPPASSLAPLAPSSQLFPLSFSAAGEASPRCRRPLFPSLAPFPSRHVESLQQPILTERPGAGRQLRLRLAQGAPVGGACPCWSPARRLSPAPPLLCSLPLYYRRLKPGPPRHTGGNSLARHDPARPPAAPAVCASTPA